MKARSLLYLTLPVAAVAAMYVAVKPQRAAETRPTAQAATALAATPTAAAPAADQVRVLYAKANTFDIVVKGGRRISEPAILKVQKGDEITLRITADVADEFHLHGYNLHMQVTPDKTATLQFTAKLTGRFPFELHKSGLELGALEVFPQ